MLIDRFYVFFFSFKICISTIKHSTTRSIYAPRIFSAIKGIMQIALKARSRFTKLKSQGRYRTEVIKIYRNELFDKNLQRKSLRIKKRFRNRKEKKKNLGIIMGKTLTCGRGMRKKEIKLTFRQPLSTTSASKLSWKCSLFKANFQTKDFQFTIWWNRILYIDIV